MYFFVNVNTSSYWNRYIIKFLDIATPGWFSTSIGILSIMLIQVAGFSLIALLLTRNIKNRELDRNDVKNFLDYREVNFKC